MRTIAELYLNFGGKFPAGVILICFCLAGLLQIAVGGYVAYSITVRSVFKYALCILVKEA